MSRPATCQFSGDIAVVIVLDRLDALEGIKPKPVKKEPEPTEKPVESQQEPDT